MAGAVCWNGRRRLADIPRSLRELLALDPQLVCYSWMTGISKVAQVVFIRKRLVEIQYLQTSIADEQRSEFGRLIEDTIRRIESADSYLTAVSVFPRTPAAVALTSGLCLDGEK